MKRLPKATAMQQPEADAVVTLESGRFVIEEGRRLICQRKIFNFSELVRLFENRRLQRDHSGRTRTVSRIKSDCPNMAKPSRMISAITDRVRDELRAPNPEMGQFVLMGLPRSGTTYVQTLLNSHPDISCAGEEFNPRAVIGTYRHDTSSHVILARDADPLAHLDQVYRKAMKTGAAQGGFKFMLGHNVAVLDSLLQNPTLKFIYIWRENRVAQVASLLKAAKSSRWAQTTADSYVGQKIKAKPRQISQRWHEFATTDYLIAKLLEHAKQPVLTMEYRDLFGPDTPALICDFLGIAANRKMKSPLVKQGSNRVRDRFENPGPIEYYLEAIGYAHWLREEI